MLNIIFKAIVGSQSFGTQTPESDIDYAGVYMATQDELYGLNKYVDKFIVNKDKYYYELKRFMELLQVGNPSCLELLYTPNDCIVHTTPQFDLIKQHRDKFLTKVCKNTFAGYAKTQIEKARGLDKKMNWEMDRVAKKDVLDFVYVLEEGKAILWKDWNKTKGYDEKFCGIISIPHTKDNYSVYFDGISYSCFSENLSESIREVNKSNQRATGNDMGLGYKGLVKVGGSENHGVSNQLRLSSIPKGEEQICIISYNKDTYSKHCKDYASYQTWLTNRNEQRYVDNITHDQKIDGKNLLHVTRLLDVAIEIAKEGKLSVRRPNTDYLLKIKRGEVPLDAIITNAEERILGLDEIYANSNLPDNCDSEFVNKLLLEIRYM